MFLRERETSLEMAADREPDLLLRSSCLLPFAFCLLPFAFSHVRIAIGDRGGVGIHIGSCDGVAPMNLCFAKVDKRGVLGWPASNLVTGEAKSHLPPY